MSHWPNGERFALTGARRRVIGLTRNVILRDSFRLLPLVIGLMLLPQRVCGDQTIEVHGIVDAANYDPETGDIHAKTKSHSTFVATLSGTGWRICVTNIDQGTWWAERLYDGTNTYVFRPYGGSFWTGTNPPRSDLSLVTVAPSVVPIPLDADPLGVFLVCLTYGLSPQSFRTNKIGLVEMPLAWTVVRNNPNAWGYKWIIHASDDGRFLNNFEVIRDKALDLPDKQELLRPQIDYPETLADYNGYMNELRTRKAVSSGHVRAYYECTTWYRTNNLVIPKVSKLEVYLPPANGSLPGRIFSLEATELEVRAGIESLLPQISTETLVADYRYKRAHKSRIFKYAEYRLRPGDFWKSGTDPKLLAQAEDWLRHGRKYIDFAEADRGKSWVAWKNWLLLVLVLLVTPALAMWFKKKQQQTKTQSKN